MNFTLPNVSLYKDEKLLKLSSYVCDFPLAECQSASFLSECEGSVSVREYGVFPGFCDVHVHLREPGFSYKETIKSGTLAAAHGGYTDVCTMPNLKPVPDSMENLQAQLDIINRDACISVHPFGSVTVGEQGEKLSDFGGMARSVVGFSDDGRGVQSESLMRSAMENAKKLDKIISAHCEDNSLLFGGYINDGEYARRNNHAGISAESEWAPIERDLKLAKETGCKYHVCHISTKKSVELIRKAKKEGVDVTSETAPHYLALDDSLLKEDGRFKMNPPLRSESDREALIEGVLDGTVDMIATDHAPHSLEEKSRGLKNSLMGVSGIECAFPVLYTRLVKPGIVPLKLVLKLLTDNPRKRFSIPYDGSLCIWDLSAESMLDSRKFISMGKSTPFDGDKIYSECVMTVKAGKTVWLKK